MDSDAELFLVKDEIPSDYESEYSYEQVIFDTNRYLIHTVMTGMEWTDVKRSEKIFPYFLGAH